MGSNQDYFDVIDTPMDFGTIRNNLESGAKYMNSRDVFKDVQYIWENCFKYNNKGDYIVDLMKRVKKNLMKYWTAAGLYTEQPQGTDGEGFMFILCPTYCKFYTNLDIHCLTPLLVRHQCISIW